MDKNKKKNLQKIQWVVIGLVCVVGIIAGYFFSGIYEKNKIDLVIDADISTGNTFQVFINEDWVAPLTLPVIPSTRYLYTFKNIPTKISNLRIDPSDVPRAEITIYGIEVRRGNEILLKLNPEQIAEWQSFNILVVSSNADALKLISANEDPILIHYVNAVVLPDITGKIVNLMSESNKLGPLADIMCLGILWVILVLFLNRRQSLWKSAYFTAALVGSYFAAWGISTLVINAGGNIPPVDSTVGYASYLGVSKEAEIRAFYLGITGAAILIFGTSLALRMVEKRDQLELEIKSREASKNCFSFIFFITVMFIYSLLAFPQLPHIAPGLVNFSHSPLYDVQNLVTWEYFRYIGWMPFRDFWYPYSGFFYTTLSFPPDKIFYWLHGILIFGVCGISVYRLLDLSKIRTVFVLLLVFWIMIAFQSFDRYFLSLDLILLFAICADTKRPVHPGFFIFFSLFIFYVFFMETAQLVYALPGCILIIVAAVFLLKNTVARTELLKKVGISVALALFLMGTYLLYLAKVSALNEFFMFYRTIGQMANYASIWLTLPSEFNHLGNSENLGLVLIFALLASSNLFRGRFSQKTIMDFLPLAIVLACLTIYQKQLVRPGMQYQLISVEAAGLALMAGRTKIQGLRGGITTKVLFSLVAGFLLMTVFIENGSAGAFWNQTVTSLKGLPSNVQLALKGPPYWKGIEKSYFSPASFSIGEMGGNDLRPELLKKMNFEKDDDLFVLGDDSYIYLALEQKAPFYITFYNQSILYSQLNTVEWLKKHKPKYVVWRSSFERFDFVPNVVRVPLIYEFITQNYVYSDTAGPFLILKIRQSDEKPSFNFWQSHLGNTLDLGLIPSRSDPTKFAVEKGLSENSFSMLSVNIQDPMQDRERELVFDIQGHDYRVKFRERQGIKSYHILLDHVWFWQLAQSQGIEPKLQLNQDGSVTFQVERIDLSQIILY
jgi:hypothetical protein